MFSFINVLESYLNKCCFFFFLEPLCLEFLAYCIFRHNSCMNNDIYNMSHCNEDVRMTHSQVACLVFLTVCMCFGHL